jgi:hypothetical protein
MEKHICYLLIQNKPTKRFCNKLMPGHGSIVEYKSFARGIVRLQIGCW